MSEVILVSTIEVTAESTAVDTRLISGFTEIRVVPVPNSSFGDQEFSGESYYKPVIVNKPRTLEDTDALDAESYPVLTAIWDNDTDTIYNSA